VGWGAGGGQGTNSCLYDSEPQGSGNATPVLMSILLKEISREYVSRFFASKLKTLPTPHI
jgi:hypothetical protein